MPWTEFKAVAGDGGSNDWFGSTLAIKGSIAFIGAKNASVNGRAAQGAVYVFVKSGNKWKQTQKLVSSDGMAGDEFGSAIALTDKLAVITAPIATIDGKLWQGAAYLFALVGDTWLQRRKIFARSGSAFETLGLSIAFNSTSLFIGAGGANHVGQYIPRRVYVFNVGGPAATNAWVEKQILDTPIPEDPTSSFGASLAAVDGVVLVGARGSNINGASGQGSVFVYTQSKGTWSPTAQLTVGDGAARDNFGVAVAMSGTRALIGSPGAAINGNISQGAVYYFERTGLDWHLRQKFAAPNGAALNLFGASIATTANTAIVGAYGANAYRGAAYVFRKINSGNWATPDELAASDAQLSGVFGFNTAIDADNALVGSFTARIANQAEQGAAYFYHRSPAASSKAASKPATSKATKKTTKMATLKLPKKPTTKAKK